MNFFCSTSCSLIITNSIAELQKIVDELGPTGVEDKLVVLRRGDGSKYFENLNLNF